MRSLTIFFCLFILTPFMAVLPAYADTRYVDDQLLITLRAGKGSDYKILQTLKSGTPVEVLEEDETYLKVKTNDGTEGYVLRQYISSALPKTLIIEKLEQEKSFMQKKIAELEETKSTQQSQLHNMEAKYKTDTADIRNKSTNMSQDLEQALKNERSMTEKYETLLAQSENVVEIAAERDQLLETNKKLAAELEVLQKTNDKMSDSRMIKWFLAGGGVFFFGWMIGKISRKKRSRL
jgi:SH3 domain protein